MSAVAVQKSGEYLLQVKNWNVRPLNKENAARIAEETGVPYFVAMMLDIRGFRTSKKAMAMLQGEDALSDHYLLPDMEKAVSRLRRAIDGFEKIAIFKLELLPLVKKG